MTNSSAPPHTRLAPLDGLRTIAVALVILFHVKAPFFAAGYIGVDIFFVLSGFLITSGLIREWDRTQRIDLGRFWTRRLRRLLPASVVMIAAVLLWALVAGSRYDQGGLGTDAFWTMLYVANWHFIGTSSYFSSDGTASELEHMWSLAVEEQFYVLWPLLFVAVAALVLRSRRPRGRRAAAPDPAALRARLLVALAGVGGVVAIVSVALLAGLFDPQAPERAYMGTDSKAFEPMLGALLAVVLAHRRGAEIARRHCGALVGAGVLVMVALFVVLDGPAPLYFYGGAGLFSLAAAALIAGAAVSVHPLVTRGLGNRPMAYLGEISYALYLWHWPWAIWLGAHETFSPTRAAAVIALTVACSIASYHLVELPIRAGRLTPWFTQRRTFVAAAVTVLTVLVPAVLVGQTPLSRPVQAAVETVAPALVPGDSDDTTVLLVGDSVPRRLTPALAPAAELRGITLVSAAAGGCSPLAVHQRISDDDTEGADCPAIEETQRLAVQDHDPSVVLWWSRYEIADRVLADGTLLRATDDGFWPAQEERFTDAVDRLTAGGATLVVVETERPGIGMLSRCSEQECHPFLRRMVMEDELRRQWNDLVAQTAAADPRVRVVNIDASFCPTADPTPITSGFGDVLCDDTVSADRLARPDGSHFDLDLVGETVSNAVIEAIEQL